MPNEVDVVPGATAEEWEAMETAALLAHQGRFGEAEAVRWKAGYHNLSDNELGR